MLDAPVSGGEAGAVEAMLSIMVGGEQADFDEAKPILDAVGKTIVLVGPSGSGQTVKAANQLIVAGNFELVAEAIVFLRAYGVDTDAALEVLAGGLAGSTVMNRKGASMLAGNFQPGFRIDLHHKDMGIIIDAARAKGVAIPLGAVAAQLIGALRAQGDGGLDHSALLRGVERLSGTQCRASLRPAQRARRNDQDAAVDAAVKILELEGATQTLRAARRGDQPVLRRHAQALAASHARARPARRGRLAHGGGLHPGQGRQHRRLHRHLGPGRHRHDHRALLGQSPTRSRSCASPARRRSPGCTRRTSRPSTSPRSPSPSDQVGRHDAGAGAGARAPSSRPST